MGRVGPYEPFLFLAPRAEAFEGRGLLPETAAELIQRYPELVEPLREGKLCITSVVELAKVITPENRREVVPRFFHASKREAKAVAAELRPAEAAPHRDVVTVPQLAAPAKAVTRLEVTTSPATPDALVQPDELRGEVPAPPPYPSPRAPLPAARPDEIEPLTGDLRRFHTTVSKRFLAKLAAARDALSHSHPGADTGEVLEAALDLLLAANDKKKGLLKKPRPSPARPSASPRHIPAERAVWIRDGRCCRWPLASGGVCGSTTRLELDHVVPLAHGGTSTVGNLRLLCAFHNQLAARQAFGEAWMDQFTSRSRPPPGEEGAPGRP